MRRVTRSVPPFLTAATLAVAALYAVPASNVYAQPRFQQQPDRSGPAPEVSDQKLDAAAAAIKQVIVIKNDHQNRIEAADPTDRERIADETKTALEKAVTEQGLSVPEYNSILVMAQNDPEVQEKIRQRIRPPGQ